MMNNCYDRITLKLAGERVEFLYNRPSKEVYNPLFPGIPIYKYPLACGNILDHETLVSIVEAKIGEFELELARYELQKAVDSFTDYSDLF